LLRRGCSRLLTPTAIEQAQSVKSRISNQKGVMLLEALIGILIFSIGILALIAMQSVAISQMRDAQYRTDASILADRLLGDLTLARSGTASTSSVISLWQAEVIGTLPGGSGTVTESASALNAQATDVRIIVKWRAPGATSDSNHIVVGLLAFNQ
jgi:type IV pilus assembly protein PilV